MAGQYNYMLSNTHRVSSVSDIGSVSVQRIKTCVFEHVLEQTKSKDDIAAKQYFCRSVEGILIEQNNWN